MSISINESGKKITVEIDGEEYGFLERHARAVNACSWTECDNTALSVFSSFVWSWPAHLFSPEPDDDWSQTLAGGIVETIDCGKVTKQEETQRLEELYEAFRAEGLLPRKEA